MASNYTRVIENVLSLQEVESFLEDFKSRIKNPKFINYEFEFKYNNIIQYFYFQIGDTPTRLDGSTDEEMKNSLCCKFTFEGHEPTVHSYISIFLNRFIDQIWGTERCRTFNCKKDTVKNRCFNKLIEFVALSRYEREEFIQKVNEQIHAVKSTEAWKNDFQDFSNKQSKLAVIDAMRKFKDVSDDVFHEALHEFIEERDHKSNSI
jgi:hypothetical protein